jgi:hypothetical protein
MFDDGDSDIRLAAGLPKTVINAAQQYGLGRTSY